MIYMDNRDNQLQRERSATAVIVWKVGTETKLPTCPGEKAIGDVVSLMRTKFILQRGRISVCVQMPWIHKESLLIK